jgi:hypothetical protein
MYSEDEVRELVAVEVRRQLEPVSDALATIRNLLMQGGFSVDEAAGQEHVDEAEQLAQFGPEVPPLEPEPDPDEPSSATPSWIQGKSETFAPAPAQA